ncbi:hypothetical protein [Rubritalea marina]|uniref:hypothetical protein n=1 Tax=Rubritalea marina TaxID=361055 RepID=UPI000366DFAA|nr:hypothetical protein [Rubritalea marina]
MAPFLGILLSALVGDRWFHSAAEVSAMLAILAGFLSALYVLLQKRVAGYRSIALVALIGLVINGLCLIVLPIAAYVMPEVQRKQHREQLDKDLLAMNGFLPQQVDEFTRFDRVNLVDGEVIEVKLTLSDAVLAQIDPELWLSQTVPAIQQAMRTFPFYAYTDQGYQLKYSYYSSSEELISEIYLTGNERQ